MKMTSCPKCGSKAFIVVDFECWKAELNDNDVLKCYKSYDGGTETVFCHKCETEIDFSQFEIEYL